MDLPAIKFEKLIVLYSLNFYFYQFSINYFTLTSWIKKIYYFNKIQFFEDLEIEDKNDFAHFDPNKKHMRTLYKYKLFSKN